MQPAGVEGPGTILGQEEEFGVWGARLGLRPTFALSRTPPVPSARGVSGQLRGKPPSATQPRADLLEEKRGSGLVPYHPVAEALFLMVSW